MLKKNRDCMNNKIISTVSVSFALLASISMQGCSGHPGAGHWESSLESTHLEYSSSQYSALEAEFDGKGTLHPNQLMPNQEGKEDLWCVWQAKTATTLDVQCGDGSAEKTNLKFELVVSQTEGELYNSAELLQAGKLVASFNRKR